MYDQQFRFLFWHLLILVRTVLEAILCEYPATIEITENVDPKRAGKIKPPWCDIMFFTANLLGITYGKQS